MKKRSLNTRLPLIFLCIAISTAAALLLTYPARAQEQDCLSCHANPDLQMTLPSGEMLPLYVSAEGIENSVHGPVGIDCQNCHVDIHSYPHPPIDFSTRRELTRSYYQACQRCHSENFQNAHDSIHEQVAQSGNLSAPVCTDCHGAHEIPDPDEPRALVSQTCGKCHGNIMDQYIQSVHGAALVETDNPDVPVCTDCHGVHNIQDPRTEVFRSTTPELCARCHANQELMKKYNISADVYDIYKISWHGVDVSVFKTRWPNIWHNSAVCTDCHGTHDIRATYDQASHVNPQNLLATCQKCHPGVGPNWVEAWTGHHPVSRERTPFVFYTEAFYNVFAYFVLWMSAIYVLLQVIRSTVERIRKSLP